LFDMTTNRLVDLKDVGAEKSQFPADVNKIIYALAGFHVGVTYD
jgi:hypothetical protein